MNYKKEPLLAVDNPYQKLAMEFLSKPQHLHFKANIFQEKKIITIEEYFTFCESQYEIIHPVFIKEYEKLIEDRQYFYGCPLSLYKETYNARLKDFLSKYPDAEEIEFLSHEGQKYKGEFLYELTDNLKKKIEYSVDKTLKYLEGRSLDIGYFLFGRNKEQEEEYLNELQNSHLDLSDTKGTEKIIYLHQLGILDYLKNKEPFKHSTNALATAISAITGIPQQTAQSYLNPISNPGADQRNNPLNSTKKVEAIKQTLINLGFKPQE